MLQTLRELRATGTEAVHVFFDAATGLQALIAVHSTTLGPAFGGCRLRAYPDEQAALTDALRLARGMSYKNALAGIPFGGGKAVILAPDTLVDRQALFTCFGERLDRLGGTYVTAMDAGTTTGDMDAIARATRYVSGVSAREGDPSPYTALGLARCIRRLAEREGLAMRGLRVTIQGVGHVGAQLCELLHQDGAELIVADPEPARTAAMAERFGVERVETRAILEIPCDVFAPCAYGGVITAAVAERLACRVIAGGANNQLAAPEVTERLAARGITYAPDYVVNAGGVIHAGLAWLGRDASDIRKRIERIPETLERVLALAEREGLDTASAADRMAEARLHEAHRGAASLAAARSDSEATP